MAKWNEVKSKALDELRRAYQAEVERFAETLRPRFASGELRGFRDADYEDGDAGGSSPVYQLERLAGEHFGLKKGNDSTAHAILAVSRFTRATKDGGWTDAAHHATAAVAREVLAIAQREGWYRVARDEDRAAA